ncbi:MAG: fluoride efflux transporter CrcB [Gammaproteobacteria bacterium]
MNQIFLIAAGGAVGSVLRFLMSTGVHGILGRAFPYGTLAVNVVGSFIMGLLYVLLIDRFNMSGEWRAALLVGLLGGFTTFSSFSIETVNLLEAGETVKALLNILLSVGVCITVTWLGIIIGRQV